MRETPVAVTRDRDWGRTLLGFGAVCMATGVGALALGKAVDSGRFFAPSWEWISYFTPLVYGVTAWLAVYAAGIGFMHLPVQGNDGLNGAGAPASGIEGGWLTYWPKV